MSKLVEYTLEVYKTDRRKTNGRRLVDTIDFAPSTRDYIETVVQSKQKQGFVVEVFETYVTRKNAMTGVEFQERYDTPYHCSPSSESFWSM